MRKTIVATAAGLALLLAVPVAQAHSGGGADVIRRGGCSRASDWKLKLGREDGGLEVEFEVDQNRVGNTWRVRLRRDGNVVFAGRRVTRPPSGSFEVRRLVRNTAGVDRFVARAVNVRTGEVCRGTAAI
jgi:hypothetical protein